MIALILSPFYLLLNFYLLRWLNRWMDACHSFLRKKWVHIIVDILYIFICTSLLTAFLLPAGTLQRYMKLLSNYWLGTLLYTILTVIIADLIRLILKHSKKISPEKLHSRKTFVTGGGICLAVIITFSIWGIVNARHIHTTRYEVNIEKEAGSLDSLNVVMIADLHLGYNIGCSHMEKMVNKINAENPDIVLIAGDIFDNEYEALEDPERLSEILRGIQSKYGVYACYGNHDIAEKILAGFTFGGKSKKMSDPRMDEFLTASQITLLRDESVLIDDAFYVYGRPDYQRPGRGIETRKTPDEITQDLDLSKPILVIDHQPKELQELADAGVDLDLCGHTHDGQLFPGNLTIKLMWENACGYLKKGNMHNIVTSGVGLFGPNMRVGTKSEICSIHVTFKTPDISSKL